MNNKITAQLSKWRSDRNMKEPLGPKEFEVAIESEVDEYTTAWRKEDTNEQIDAIADITIFCLGELLAMGYSPELVLKKTIAHISDRNQDPAQKLEWERNGPSGKWAKDSSKIQDQPDYSVCKLSS